MILDEPQEIGLSFKGDGIGLLKLYFVNMLLMIVTLGFYFPWAKAAVGRYMHSNTELDGKPFVFHGTGKEMFIGFLKAVGIMILFGALFNILPMILGFYAIPMMFIVMVIFSALITPYVIHGSMRYRTSRTSWNGIHWGYRGKLNVFAGKFIGGWILTVLTLGIYGAWYAQTLRRYLVGNTRFGNTQFNYEGDGLSYLLLHLKGILLTIFTLGIYSFWYNKDIFSYFLDNTSADLEGDQIEFRTELTGVAICIHLFSNMLLIIFTLGFGFPWAIVRSLRFFYANIIIEGSFNTEKLINTEEEYNNALGVELGDVMDASF